MIKIKKSKPISILFLIFIISFLFISNNPTNATPYDSSSEIEITYDKEAADDPVLPVDLVKEIPIYINYFIEGYFADEIVPFYYNTGFQNYLYLSVVDTPSWCNATISPPFLKSDVSAAEGVISNATLSIRLNENAQAFHRGTVLIRVDVGRMGAILPGNFTKNIEFNPGYLPFLKIDVLEETAKSINPEEIATFDVKITNLGNADTNCSIKALGVPKGWTVKMDSNVIIGSHSNNSKFEKTITVSIKPPHDIGYHNDREVITVSITPSYYNDASLSGHEYLIHFTVGSRGYSSAGSELYLPIFVLFIIISFILYIIIKKRRKTKEGRF